LPAETAPRSGRAARGGAVRPLRLLLRPRAPPRGQGDGRLLSLALPRGAAARRGEARPRLRGAGGLRPPPPHAARRPVADPLPLEVRLQEPEVDRPDRAGRGGPAHLLARPPAGRVRLLLERQPRQAPPALEPGARTGHWHRRAPGDAALQRVW